MTTITSKTQKLRSALKLLDSKTFILVTDKESIMFVDYGGLTGELQLASLKSVRYNLDKSIKQFEQSNRRT